MKAEWRTMVKRMRLRGGWDVEPFMGIRFWRLKRRKTQVWCDWVRQCVQEDVSVFKAMEDKDPGEQEGFPEGEATICPD